VYILDANTTNTRNVIVYDAKSSVQPCLRAPSRFPEICESSPGAVDWHKKRKVDGTWGWGKHSAPVLASVYFAPLVRVLV